jgi:folylpolyglutamate synthase/dihydropteroate synthase
MSTKAEILKRLENVADDEIIAVPTIKTKADAEDLYEYAYDEEVTLTQEQWAQVIESYENADDYSDEALVEVVREVLGS